MKQFKIVKKYRYIFKYIIKATKQAFNNNYEAPAPYKMIEHLFKTNISHDNAIKLVEMR